MQDQNQEGHEYHHQGQQPVINSEVQGVHRPVPPTLLRIFADNQDKRAVCFFWVVFLIVIVAIVIAANFLPQSTLYRKNQQQLKQSNLQSCFNPTQFNDSNYLICNPIENVPNITKNKIGITMIDLIRQNQFVMVYFQFYIINSDISTQCNNILKIAFNSYVYINFYSLISKTDNGAKMYQEVNNQSYQTNLKVDFRLASKLYGDDKSTLIGYATPIFAARNFNDQSFLLVANFDKNVADANNIASLSGAILVVNPEFTKFVIIIRYVFFGLALIAGIIYIIRFRKIPVEERIIQQKMIVVMSILLVFFNDPFYPITILYPNKASSYFSVLFVINFLVFLIFVWIMFVDRIVYQDGQKQSNLLNWKRIGYIIVLWIFLQVFLIQLAYEQIDGAPIIPAQTLMKPKFLILGFFQLGCFLIGFGYIMVSYCMVWINIDKLMWRNKLFLYFSIFFILVTTVLMMINGFQLNPMVGKYILLIYTIMNMYTFYLQYMYSITPLQLQRVTRGEYENQGDELLQVGSGKGDCVDLQFDDLPISGQEGGQQKINVLRDKNKNYQLQLIGKKDNKLKQKNQRQLYYDKDVREQNIQVQSEKQTEFFHDQKFEEQVNRQKKKNKQQNAQKIQNQFEQFTI